MASQLSYPEMNLKFDTTELLPGDIIHVRGFYKFSYAIRAIIGSVGNHDGMAVLRQDRFYIGEAVPPRSKLTTLEEYEAKMSTGEIIVRVYRPPNATIEQRRSVSNLFIETKLGIDYPMSVARLWPLRFVNSLPWKIKGQWCTKIVFEAWHAVVPGSMDRPPDRQSKNGKRKKNPTPRTTENRLAIGVLHDVTDACVKDIV